MDVVREDEEDSELEEEANQQDEASSEEDDAFSNHPYIATSLPSVGVKYNTYDYSLARDAKTPYYVLGGLSLAAQDNLNTLIMMNTHPDTD